MIDIIKASGETAPFDPDKLRRSLKRVGTTENLLNHIVNEVTHALKPGMTTRTIYRIAFSLLRKHSRTTAAKYHLKRALMNLGITGYPFEKYVSELLQAKGFAVQTNQIIAGHCVNHEVDVVAKMGNKSIIVECKYHHRSGLKSNVVISLYFKARFDDILQGHQNTINEPAAGWLVTNTRFTTDATQYGLCAGLHLISWDFPAKDSLKEIIEITGLYPITCITDLTKTELNQLVGNNIVLCKTLYESPNLLDPLRIPAPRRKSVLQQCQTLYEPVL